MESGHAAGEEAGTLPSNGTSAPGGVATLTEMFPLDLLEKLKALSRSEKVTVSLTLLCAYQTVLYRYSGEEESSGSPTANLSGTEALSNVFGGGLSGNPTFRQLLHRAHSALPGRSAEQNAPFQNPGALAPEGNLNGAPLFQIRLALGTAPRPQLKLPAVDPRVFAIHSVTSQPDFDLSLVETAAGLSGAVQYTADLFDARTIHRFLGHFRTLLEAIAANPDQFIGDLPLLPAQERHTLLVEFNATEAKFRKDLRIHDFFEQSVQRNPESVALVRGDERLSYAELNTRANQIAHYLQKRGVVPETLVGICTDRSLDMLAGILGILKAGGAYVPLDPIYPRERLRDILEDSKAPIVLSRTAVAGQLPECSAEQIFLDAGWEEISREPETNPTSAARPENLAYVLFTSGSTGRPKGVALEHRSAATFLEWAQRAFTREQLAGVLLSTSICFDLSVFEMFAPLSAGGKIIIAENALYLPTLPAKNEVTLINTVPSAMTELLNMKAVPDSVTTVNLAGEALAETLVERIYTQTQVKQVYNLYGPTEDTTYSTYTLVPRGARVTIGKPLTNSQAYVVDAHRNPVPIGVPGELYLAGDGLARGYYGRADLTAERFVPNPFGGEKSPRMYKTGDLCRWLADGNLEYLGRLDHQVKLRGFRIELGEIEKTLESCPGIRQSVVVAQEDPSGAKRLVAYVVSQPESGDGAEPQVEEFVSAEFVSQWAMTFDETYERAGKGRDATFNIAGWNSSYTGEPIAAEETQTWVETTVDRILALQPKRVWEIGCGTGLLLFRVAPHCERYHGTEISQTALDFLTRQLAHSTPQLPQVTLARKAAHEIDGVGSDYDTVILNSVTQYFPDIHYLTAVIEGAVRSVRPGGTVFIGDVRNLALLEMLHTSVQLHHAPDSLSSVELRRRIEKKVREERELLVAPDFFLALQQRIPEISAVQIQMKRGWAHNELTRFRYDVFLKIGEPAAAKKDCIWLDWNKQPLSLAQLRQVLAQQQPEILGLTGVPNARLRTEVAAGRLLASNDPPATAGEIRERLKYLVAPAALDPEDLWELERDLPYTVEIRASRDGSCDLLLRRQTAAGNAVCTGTVSFPSETHGNGAQHWEIFASNPLQKVISREMVAQLRHFVRAKLPEYMVPSAFVLLNSIPLTANGKLDRRALPAPDWSHSEGRSDYAAPRTPVEETIADIFADVLKLEAVGRDDNFFEIGGHSLSAAEAVLHLGQTLQVEIPLRRLFESPTIAALAQAVEGMQCVERTVEMPAIESSQKRLGLPVSIAQEALWYQDQLAPGHPVYNFPLVSRLRGDLRVAAFEQAISNTVERHELLRSVFLSSHGTPLLFPVKKWRGRLEQTDLRHLQISDREREAQRLVHEASARPFDLARDPVLRCFLFRLADDEYLFLHISPHIVFDGASVEVFYRDLAAFYGALLSGKKPELPELPFQFADFAVWQRRCVQGEYLKDLSGYWNQKVSGAPHVDLPLDFSRPPVHTFRGTRRFFVIPADLISSANAFFRSARTTPFRGFYAAFNVFLHCYTGLHDLCVGSPFVPVNPACRGAEHLIGYFINTLVLRTDVSEDPTFREIIRRGEEVLDGALAHSDLPFAKIAEALQFSRDPSRTPLFQVNFRVLNEPYCALKLDGIVADPPAYVDTGTAKFDLALEIESSIGQACYFEYCSDLFREETIMQMEQDYQALLRGLIAQPEVPISKLSAVIEVSQRIRSRTAAGKSV